MGRSLGRFTIKKAPISEGFIQSNGGEKIKPLLRLNFVKAYYNHRKGLFESIQVLILKAFSFSHTLFLIIYFPASPER